MRYTKEFLKVGITDKPGDTKLLTDLIMKGDENVINTTTMLELSSINKVNEGLLPSLLYFTWIQKIGSDYYAGGFNNNQGIIYKWDSSVNYWSVFLEDIIFSAQTCGGYYIDGGTTYLLIGTLINGLYRIDLSGTDISQFKTTLSTPIPENAIRTIEYNETIDKLYVGDSEGIWRWDDPSWTQLPTISDEVLSIIKKDDGKLLVGTANTGFFWSLDDTTFNDETTTDIIFDTINDMCECVNDSIILATNSYLWKGDWDETSLEYTWTHIDDTTPYGEVGEENTGILYLNDTLIVSARDGIYSSADGLIWEKDEGNYLSRGTTQFEGLTSFFNEHFVAISKSSGEYKYAIEFQIINNTLYDYIENNTNTSWIDRWIYEIGDQDNSSYTATGTIEINNKLVSSVFRTGLAGYYVTNIKKTRNILYKAPDNTYINMLTCVVHDNDNDVLYFGSLGGFVYKVSNWNTNPVWESINPETPAYEGFQANVRDLYYSDGYLFIGTDDGLFIYDVNLESFSDIAGSDDLQIYKITKQDDIYFVGTDDGLFEFTDNTAGLGSDWALNNGIPTIKINDILFYEYRETKYVSLATNQKMYLCEYTDSSSLGDTDQPFEQITDGITDNDCIAISFDGVRQLLYVGTHLSGNFISSNGGLSYSSHDSTYFLDTININDLYFSNNNNSLYINNYGKGKVWRYDEYGELEKQDFFSDLVIESEKLYDTLLVSNVRYIGVEFNLNQYLEEFIEGIGGIRLSTDSEIIKELSEVYENEKNKVFSVFTKITNAEVVFNSGITGEEDKLIYQGDITHTKFFNIDKFSIINENNEGHYIPNPDFITYMINNQEEYFRNNLLETNQYYDEVEDVLHLHALSYNENKIYIIKSRYNNIYGDFEIPDQESVNEIDIPQSYSDIQIKRLELNIDSGNDFTYFVLLDNTPYLLYTKKETGDTEYGSDSLIQLNNDTFIDGVNKYYGYNLTINKDIETFKNSIFMKINDNGHYIVLSLYVSDITGNDMNSTEILGNNIVMEERYISSINDLNFLYIEDNGFMENNISEGEGEYIISVIRDNKYLSNYSVDTKDKIINSKYIDLKIEDLSNQTVNSVLFYIMRHLFFNFVNFVNPDTGFNLFPIKLTLELNSSDYYVVINFNDEEFYLRTSNQEYNISFDEITYKTLESFDIKFYDNTDTEVNFYFNEDLPLNKLLLSINNKNILEKG